MLVDSHCHLDYADYGADRDDVMRRARLAGVGTMLTISTKLSAFPAVRAVAEQYPDVFCTVGVHPHEAASEGPDADAAKLVALAAHPRVVGIGETGLDYYYEHAPRAAQGDSFRAHIAASRETQLPLIVHTRDADDDTIAILKEEQGKGAFPGLLHCFSSGRKMAETALEQGFYISFSGILTFKNAVAVREVAQMVPLDRLLIETDAPYLAPVPNRGKRNEPAFVAHTAQTLADMRGLSLSELGDITTENFFRLFTKAQRPAAAA
ncbi:MAG TPA: TatD family hydrolase [Alphaproteobacteria bacterium]|nr:TatD family hydrolase [Alphaproteobacteria bacterium]